MRWLAAVAVMLALASSACSSSQQATGMYRAELGRAPSMPTMVNVVNSTLRSFGYQTRVAGNQVRTDWQTRSPRAGEGMLEVNQVRDRIRINVRPRGQGLVTADIVVEYEIQKGTGAGWERAPIPETVRDQYSDIRQDIRRQLEQYMTQE